MQQNGPGMPQGLQAGVTRETRGMDPSSPTQMEQGYNTRLPPSTSSFSSPERSEGSGLPGLGARQAAQNLSSCQGQQQQQQQQAMQQGQCPQAAAPSLVESQFLSCAPGLAQWPSMTAVPPSVTGQCSQGSQNGPHGCCSAMGNTVGFCPQGCFQRPGFLPMNAIPGQGCLPFGNQPQTSLGPQLNQPPAGNMFPGVGLKDVVSAASNLDSAQILALTQWCQEQVRQRAQAVPSRFGEVNRVPSEPFMPDFHGAGLPLPSGMCEGLGRSDVRMDGNQAASQDVFSRTEKWLGVPPQPQFSTWVNRESEVLGFSQYYTDLASWASQASLEFGQEILQAGKWPVSISWSSMTIAMRSRSMRLLAILKSSFQGHPRTSNLIHAYMEGIQVSSGMSEVSREQDCNGYELLRQLAREYSLRSRGEALAFRTSLATKTFVVPSNETSPSSMVSDTIRRIELECAKYQRLLSSLPSSVDPVGLQVSDADMLMMLVRSLPDSARSFALHHASGESYQAYREAARRFEQQQRLFLDIGHVKGLNQVEFVGQDGETQWFDMTNGDETWEHGMNAVQNGKCTKCGSKKHETKECSVDLSKVRCFRCSQYGHVGVNCPNRSGSGVSKGSPKGKGKENTGKGKRVSKGDQWKKGKSSGKGKSTKGKKGKLNETSEEWDPEESWWWNDNDWWGAEGWQDPGVAQVWDDSYDWSQQQFGSWTQYREDNPQLGLENAPDGNGKEQTVGSLIFAPMLHVMSETNANDCQTCVVCARDVLDNSLVCSTCAGISFEGFGNFDNSDVFETQTSFDDVLDDSGKFSGLEEFWKFRPGLVGSLTGAEDAAESLVSPACARVQVFKPAVSTFLDLPATETCSLSQRLSVWSPLVAPLLSQMTYEDASWWLLDSGASATVLAESCMRAFGIDEPLDVGMPNFKTANGGDVGMRGIASLQVSMLVSEKGKQGLPPVWKKAKMHVLVGRIQHNILSTTLLCQSGWYFSQTPDSFSLKHKDGATMMEVSYFCGCPWVRLHPWKSLDEDWMNHKFALSGLAEGSQQSESCLCPVSKSEQIDLATHRRQGHTPHHPACSECARGHSTFQHRRRAAKGLSTEFQADFCWLKKEGEVLDHMENQENLKILVVVELATNNVGYIVIGEDKNAIYSQINQYLQQCGISSTSTSVLIHTDAEKAVGELFTKSGSQFSFAVRRSNPQQHQSTGGAERCVRRLKESLSILRADLSKCGVDIKFAHEPVQTALTYLLLCHNHFSKTPGTDLSPLENACGRRLSKPTSSLFCTTVMAELPDSVKQRVPNETRLIEAAFLHCGTSHGPVVQGKVRLDGVFTLIRFTARNVRVVEPLKWDLDLCSEFLYQTGESPERKRIVAAESGPQDEIKPPEDGDEQVLEREPMESSSRQQVSSGPVGVAPKPSLSGGIGKQAVSPDSLKGQRVSFAESSRVFQKTRRCPACESGMDAPGSRHNAECKRRRKAFEAQNGPESASSPSASTEMHSPSTPEKFVDAPVDGGTPTQRQELDTRVDVDGDTNMPEVELGSVFSVGDMDSSSVGDDRKRTADVDVSDLEKQIREDPMMDSLFVHQEPEWCCSMSCQPLQHLGETDENGFQRITSPELFSSDETVSAIQFRPDTRHESVTVRLGDLVVVR